MELQKCRAVIGVYRTNHPNWHQAQTDYAISTLGLSLDEYIGSVILMNYYFQSMGIISDFVVKVAGRLEKPPKLNKANFYKAVEIASKIAALGMNSEADLTSAIHKFKEVMRLE